MSIIKDKIVNCEVDLHMWGSLKTRPDVDEIKRLQAVMENINKCEPSEETRAEYLEASLMHYSLSRKFSGTNALEFLGLNMETKTHNIFIPRLHRGEEGTLSRRLEINKTIGWRRWMILWKWQLNILSPFLV